MQIVELFNHFEALSLVTVMKNVAFFVYLEHGTPTLLVLRIVAEGIANCYYRNVAVWVRIMVNE